MKMRWNTARVSNIRVMNAKRWRVTEEERGDHEKQEKLGY